MGAPIVMNIKRNKREQIPPVEALEEVQGKIFPRELILLCRSHNIER
jgi:hypothetical protein